MSVCRVFGMMKLRVMGYIVKVNGNLWFIWLYRNTERIETIGRYILTNADLKLRGMLMRRLLWIIKDYRDI